MQELRLPPSRELQACVEFHVEKKNKPPFCLRDIQWTEYNN